MSPPFVGASFARLQALTVPALVLDTVDSTRPVPAGATATYTGSGLETNQKRIAAARKRTNRTAFMVENSLMKI